MKAFKKPIVVPFEILTEDTIIETLEGPVSAVAGSYVLTGVKGERWPMSLAKFAAAYEALNNINAVKRKAIVEAIKVPTKFFVEVNWTGQPSLLTGNPGDWLIINGNDAWVVANEIFLETYEIE